MTSSATMSDGTRRTLSVARAVPVCASRRLPAARSCGEKHTRAQRCQFSSRDWRSVTRADGDLHVSTLPSTEYHTVRDSELLPWSNTPRDQQASHWSTMDPHAVTHLTTAPGDRASYPPAARQRVSGHSNIMIAVVANRSTLTRQTQQGRPWLVNSASMVVQALQWITPHSQTVHASRNCNIMRR